MSTEFKLSYTASEINEKLGKVDDLVASVNGIAPDANGNVEVTSGIIDVLELPTENISENSFYRLMTAYLVYNQYDQRDYNRHCYCVNNLPDVGNPVTTNMEDMIVYYNIGDGDVYGYITDALGSMAGVPAGWYTLATLAPLFDVTWNGVITDIDDDPCDGSFRLLLTQDFYIYQDEWIKTVFAYEKMPEFDIRWDGVIGDRFALDVSSLGFANTYFVKVSDEVFTSEQLVGGKFTQSNGNEFELTSDNIDATTYAGALDVYSGVVVVYAQEDLNAALGLPSGYITNGTYFVYIVDAQYTNRLVAPSKITKINSKYIDIDEDNSNLHAVAFTGDYYSLVNQPTIYTDVVRYTVTQSLSSTYKSRARSNIDVYSKSEVDAKIGSGVDLSAYSTTTEVETMIDNNLALKYVENKLITPAAYWNSVCYGNGKYVAVGLSVKGGGIIAYLEDGINWVQTAAPQKGWNSVCYGNGKYVAVASSASGSSYHAAYSEDGINWVETTMPQKGWNSVCYGNGKYVAVGSISSSGHAAYSEDGINWVETTMPVANWNSVCYGNGKYVAVGYDSTASAYSEDGIAWTDVINVSYTSLAQSSIDVTSETAKLIQPYLTLTPSDIGALPVGPIEGTPIILTSPNGTRYQLAVADDGTLTATEVTEATTETTT